MRLFDSHNRHIHKLRLSLLDACNLRCIYCMPQNPQFLNQNELLSRQDIKSLSSILVNLGIDEIRLTGGEPTMRSDFMDIVKDLSLLELKKLAFTTNGLFLKQHLPKLKKTECRNRYKNYPISSIIV